MVLLRRRLRCHYCNVQARDSVSHIPKTYLCPQCDAVNHFDERGNITDPPVEEITTAPVSSFQYLHSRSPSPAMPIAGEELFCDTCQHNQTLVANILAEYLPEEDDPKYEKFLASYDAYKSELEDRYPQVCQNCLPRVQDQIRNAGYAARADHLRRIMEKSDERRRTVQTSRQAWTLRIISLAKWAYISSTLIGMLWHMFGLLMAPNDGVEVEEAFKWDTCLSQAISVHSIDRSCVLSPYLVNVVQFALVIDLITIWWNPKLKVKTNSLTGRMSGLKSLWSVRITTLSLRSGCLFYWKHAVIDNGTLWAFQSTHLFMLIALGLSCILTWKTVRIVYTSPTSLHRLGSENLASAPNSAEKATRATHHPSHSQSNIFDNMAQAFTTSFQDTSALPPSPTLTATSYSTHATTEATTPFAERKSAFGDDDMDWTPTQRRFAAHTPTILPHQWSQEPPQPQQNTYQERHSLFSKKDPNPFRHKIPAAPRAPAQMKANPWKPGVWDPPLKDATPNFFKEEQKARGGVGEVKGLDGLGVPKSVKRNAEMFASPKLKYDYYGTMKDTGLEDTFNGLFSK
ncbi:Ima1 N-terminal domain-containing protein [Pyrenochaeta sp. MPI-SDFR-AT-0127]|nr:Ima1 N-terminal domain-containing protein [Pyrenochaeta sp. MPI-SDFR-AT-0127]